MVPVKFYSYHKKDEQAPPLMIARCVVAPCSTTICTTIMKKNANPYSNFVIDCFKITVNQQNNRVAWICEPCVRKYHNDPDRLILKLLPSEKCGTKRPVNSNGRNTLF